MAGALTLSGTACSTPTHQARGAKEAIEGLKLQLPDDDAIAGSVRNGLQLLKKGRFADAAKAFSDALKLDPRNGAVHFLTGLSYHLLSSEGDSSQAELAEIGFRQALKFTPGHVQATLHLGHLKLQQKSFRQAQDAYAYAVLLEPSNSSALQGLAVASYFAHDLRTARSAVDAALELGTPSPELVATAALIWTATGDGKAARSSLAKLEGKRASRLEPRIAAWERHLAEEKADSIRLSSAAPARPLGTEASTTPSPKMCMIDVVIISTEDLRSHQRGVNLLNGLQLQYNASLTRKRDKIDPLAGDFTTTETGTWQRTLTDAITIPAINYNLNIFNEAGLRHEIVARPTLIATDGKASDFFSGASLHVELSGGTGGTGSLQDVQIGVRLAVTPQFLDPQRIQLQVEASRDFLDAPASSASFRSFVQTSKARIAANVTIGFDETLIIGGLSERDNQTRNDGVPVLDQIPLIQTFFSKKVRTEYTKSVMVLLTPRRPRYSDQETSAQVTAAMNAGAPSSNAVDGSAPPTVQKLATRDKRFFKPIPNLDRIMQELDQNDLFILIRDGDLRGQEWVNPKSLKNTLQSALEYFYF